MKQHSYAMFVILLGLFNFYKIEIFNIYVKLYK